MRAHSRILAGALLLALVGACDRAPAVHEELAFWSGDASLAEVEGLPESVWQAMDQPLRNFGRGKTAWMRLRLVCRERTLCRRIILTGPPSQDYIDLYTSSAVDGALHARHGDRRPFQKGMTPALRPSVALHLRPGETGTVYVRFQGVRGSSGELSSADPVALQTIVERRFAAIGAFLGLYVLFLLAALLFLLVGRQWVYGSYLLYLVFMAFYSAGQLALLHRFVFPQGGYWTNEAPLAALFLAFFFLTTFFLQIAPLSGSGLRERGARWIIHGVRILFVAMAVIILIDWEGKLHGLVNPVSLIGLVGIVAYSLFALRGAARYARLILVGWIFLALGFLPLALLAYLPWLSLQLAQALANSFVAMESLVLLLAVALRYRDDHFAELQRRAELERIGGELEQARRVHSALLPPMQTRSRLFDIETHYLPESAVGGDLFAYQSYPDERQLVVLVADVTGHGLSAALDSSAVAAAFRRGVARARQPQAILREMNQFLTPHLNMRFVTACCLLADMEHWTLYSASAGHVPPLLISGDVCRYMENEGALLGLDVNASYAVVSARFAPGDRLALYTDGLIESGSRTMESYGSKAMIEAAQRAAMLDGPGFVASVTGDMARWRSDLSQQDDITLLLVDFRAGD